MRITGGKATGRSLRVPKGLDVRPTPDLVKQAIFNSLGNRVVGARVLELFAGTGALSLECLSRGAAHVVCVEKAQRHAVAIRHNLESVGAGSEVLEVRVQDVFVAIPQLTLLKREFDLVIADPPYGEKNVGRRSRSLAQRLLDDTDLPKLLGFSGLFVLGHTKRDTLEITERWQELKILKHGDTVMRFLKVRSKSSQEQSQPGISQEQ